MSDPALNLALGVVVGACSVYLHRAITLVLDMRRINRLSKMPVLGRLNDKASPYYSDLLEELQNSSFSTKSFDTKSFGVEADTVTGPTLGIDDSDGDNTFSFGSASTLSDRDFIKMQHSAPSLD